MSEAISRTDFSCLWFNDSHIDRRQKKCVAHTTLMITSVLSLALSIIFTLVSTGVVWERYPFFAMVQYATFGAGLILTLSVISTCTTIGIILESCTKPPKRTI